MAETKPRSEQIRFISENTGEHVLDEYLEACERAGIPLYDLIDLIFDANGEVNPDFVEFRFNNPSPGTYQFQYRLGSNIDPDANWVTITDPIFQDIVNDASDSADLAEAWANQTSGAVAASEYSAKAYAIGGTGVTNTAGKGAAKEWATKTGGTVDGTEYSAKKYAQDTAADKAATAADVITTNANVVTTNNNVTAAQSAQSAAEAAANGMKWRPSVRAATTANITLSGAQTIDGVSVVAGDRVLVKNQSTQANNGVYVAASGSWTRATDADSWSELVGQVVVVEEGTANADTPYICTVNQGGTLGSTSIKWANIPTAIVDGSVTNAKLANMSANTIKGTVAGGVPADLTVSQVWDMLAPFYSNGRLTATTGTPVTLTDAPSVTTLHFTPYQGNKLSLYNGSSWVVRTFSEIAIALGTLTSDKNYDLFAYDNAGTVAFDSPVAWTNDTTRATALVLQDGIWVKSGATTRRYIGSFRTISTTATCDTQRQRFLFNALNPVERSLLRKETTGSWTYSSATIRQANGNSSNKIEVLDGLGTLVVHATLAVTASNATACVTAAGFGLDSTTTFTSTQSMGFGNIADGGAEAFQTTYIGQVGLGYHYLAWLEGTQASGTTTWYGNGTPSFVFTFAQMGGINGTARM